MNIALPAGMPVDLYAASGISAGMRLVVHNVGTDEAHRPSCDWRAPKKPAWQSLTSMFRKAKQ